MKTWLRNTIKDTKKAPQDFILDGNSTCGGQIYKPSKKKAYEVIKIRNALTEYHIFPISTGQDQPAQRRGWRYPLINHFHLYNYAM